MRKLLAETASLLSSEKHRNKNNSYSSPAAFLQNRSGLCFFPSTFFYPVQMNHLLLSPDVSVCFHANKNLFRSHRSDELHISKTADSSNTLFNDAGNSLLKDRFENNFHSTRNRFIHIKNKTAT
jgi:hypothetical protein